MTIKQAHYEEVLADCSNHVGAIALLKHYRPYLELIPSMRRPQESVITIPLPLIRVRQASHKSWEPDAVFGETLRLPCDLAILMCDPEWKIKTGVEIFVFIHRPQEDFSDLLNRWRQTQIFLDKNYEWLMPPRHEHILSEGADQTRPLFVLFPETPDRIRRGLRGAYLPYVMQTAQPPEEAVEIDSIDALDDISSEVLGADEP